MESLTDRKEGLEAMSESCLTSENGNNNEAIDYSRDLANLEFILQKATNMLPEETESPSKSTKSNPLLEQLLDKPISHENNKSELKRNVDKESDQDSGTSVGSTKRSRTGGSESSDSDNDDDDGDDDDDDDDDDDNNHNNDNDSNSASSLASPSSSASEDEKDAEPKMEESAALPEETKVKKAKKKTLKSTRQKATKENKKIMKSLMRKNIKNIISDKELEVETLAARKEEEERIRRLHERSQMILQQRRSFTQQVTITSAGYQEDVCVVSSDEEQGSPKKKMSKMNAEVIDILSDDEDGHQAPAYANHSMKTSYTVQSLMPDVDEDECCFLEDECSMADDEQDMNNCGVHTDDSLNVPDSEGRVLVNVGHPESEEPIYLASHLAKYIKPHQVGGVRFLYDNVIESISQFEKTTGLGCILAHSMGLGKTLQLISFIDVFLTHTTAKHVLCIVPVNTLQNWVSEFDHWLPAKTQSSVFDAFRTDITTDIKYRSFTVYALGDCKTTTSRAREIVNWREKGGVLLLGYEIYRMLCNLDPFKGTRRKDDSNDLSEEEKKRLRNAIREALIDPGPDLIVCDEGHRIKNANAATSQALKSIRTKRRVVLTGYPLQNNLTEYWCMVDFVRPNFLGTKVEFCNMFERPIQNGQCVDSTPQDRKLMRYRSHVLHSLLRGFVQRRSHSILTKTLPQKHEHVILVRLTPIQKTLLSGFLQKVKSEPGNNGSLKINPIMLFSVCCKIWNHPDVLYHAVNEGKALDDFDEEEPVKTKKGNKRVTKAQAAATNLQLMESQFSGLIPPRVPLPEPTSSRVMDLEWAKPYLSSYTPGVISNGMKMVILFEIIAKTLSLKDRILIFSQSLLTLDTIEKFLQHSYVPLPDAPQQKWSRNVNYYRLDGSTNAQERERLINGFNQNSHVHLFLLSTRAGCLGINLIGANRIVVLDASWNPCHDAQAACRIYRYGQQKECYIYRLVCDNSLEKKIYDRQVNKQGMSNRIVDEMNTETNFTWREINSLIEDLDQFNEPPAEEFTKEALDAYDDDVIRHICESMNHCITRKPFEHESLLLDQKETKLSSYEKKFAEKSYLLAKQARTQLGITGGVYGQRNVYMPTVRGSVPVRQTQNLYLEQSRYPQYNTSIYNCPNNVLPSQPLPAASSHMYPAYSSSGSNYYTISGTSSNESQKGQAHVIKRITVPTDVTIPVDKNNQRPPIFVPKGQDVYIIQTSSGWYLKTLDNRVASLNFNQADLSAILGDNFSSLDSSKLNTGISILGKNSSTSSASFGPSTSTSERRTPEVIDLSDDDDSSPNIDTGAFQSSSFI